MKDELDDLRSILRRVADGREVLPLEARQALRTLDRLYPPPALVAVPHAWCICDHQHERVAATGKPATECIWVFCTCPGFRPRSLGPRPEEEKARLSRELKEVLRAWDAQRERRGR